MATIRTDRLAEEVKAAVSDILREMKDPRVSEMCTVMQVELTPDLKFAKIKVSVFDEEPKRLETVRTLNRAAGFIARELGSRITIRRLPALNFVLDSSIEYSIHISGILANLKNTGKE